MKRYTSIPRELIDGWSTSTESHLGEEQLAFHYHDAEEWVEVLEGEITFISAGELLADRFSVGEYEFPVAEGQALHIPRGDVHCARVSRSGVSFRLWAPVEVVANELNTENLALIRRNLDVPRAEDEEDEAFLDDLLSQDLTFRTATGKLLCKKALLDRGPADIMRTPSDSIRVLHMSSESALLSTVVHTEPRTGGPRQSFSNSRLFVEEEGAWKLRVWLNYPESAAP